MNVFVIHPSGNNFNRILIATLFKHNMLAEFDTSIAINGSSKWLNLLPGPIRQELLRRTFPVPLNKIYTYPLREAARLILPKIGLKYYTRHEAGWACTDAVYNELDKAAAKRLPALLKKQKIDAVYAYEDGALETFLVAKKLGIKCIYDLPIAYWETGSGMMKEEAERLPDWAITLKGIRNSDEKLERKTRELELADIVVGPSEFVKSSLPRWAEDKQYVMAPFGSPQLTAEIRNVSKPEASRPLRVLFVGSMTQRKGLGDLFAAMKLLNRADVELVVMGSLQAPMDFYRQQYADFVYEEGRPNQQVLELMRSCDVFCMPSIVEGRALVMQEAMSQGLPLIITPNTGGADLVIEGETGFLVPIRSPEAVAARINWFADNRDQISQMGEKARDYAAKYTWENYSNVIIAAINSIK